MQNAWLIQMTDTGGFNVRVFSTDNRLCMH